MNLRRDYHITDCFDAFEAHLDIECRVARYAKDRKFLQTLDWTDEQVANFQKRVQEVNDRCDEYLTAQGR